MDKHLQDQINEFLDDIREMGQVNMFGAGSIVAEEFNLDDKKARDYLKNWMNTFAQRHHK